MWSDPSERRGAEAGVVLMIRHGGDFFGAEDDAIALAVGEVIQG
jgi:hypothetical protein